MTQAEFGQTINPQRNAVPAQRKRDPRGEPSLPPRIQRPKTAGANSKLDKTGTRSTPTAHSRSPESTCRMRKTYTCRIPSNSAGVFFEASHSGNPSGRCRNALTQRVPPRFKYLSSAALPSLRRVCMTLRSRYVSSSSFDSSRPNELFFTPPNGVPK